MTNAASDTLSVIDTRKDEVVETLWAKGSPADLFGASPNALVFDPTGDCIFAIEDDPQAGWDHVSGFRTTAYLISPYTKRNAVIHTQYNQTSIIRSIELILGLPPMNQFNATATPMGDCFTAEPDFTPYEAVPTNVPLDQMNPDPKAVSDRRLRKDAIASAKLPLDQVDQCPEDVLNRILWRAMKGPHAPYPEWAVMADLEDGE